MDGLSMRERGGVKAKCYSHEIISGLLRYSSAKDVCGPLLSRVGRGKLLIVLPGVLRDHLCHYPFPRPSLQ